MEVASWLHWIFSHLTTDFKQLWWLTDWAYDILDHFWSPHSNTVSTCETRSWKRPASIQSWPDSDSPAATLRIAKVLQNNCYLIYKHSANTLQSVRVCRTTRLQLVTLQSGTRINWLATTYIFYKAKWASFFVRRWHQICNCQVLYYHKETACNCNLTSFNHKLIADWLCVIYHCLDAPKLLWRWQLFACGCGLCPCLWNNQSVSSLRAVQWQ